MGFFCRFMIAKFERDVMVICVLLRMICCFPKWQIYYLGLYNVVPQFVT